MRPSDIDAFRNCLTALCMTFSKEFSEPLFDAYWMGLSDLDIKAFQIATARAVRQCTFFPKPVELRQLAGEQTGEQRAIAAWGDALRAVPRGPYKHIDFSDPIINATIRNLGGWPTFIGRFTDEESEKWVRLEFIKAYQNLSAGGADGEVCQALPGLSQMQSIGGELREPIPIRIECDPSRSFIPKIAQNPLSPSVRLELKTVDAQ